MSASAVLWHDLECGSYKADLPMWCELTGRVGSPALDLGAGTGRVTLDLAGRAHPVVALDHDPELIDELRRRAGGLPVETVLADVREFALERRFPLVIVPMQTVQLLAGADERAALLRSVARHLAPGGLFAAAIVDAAEATSTDDDDELPAPDVLHRDGWVYSSQPLRVALDGDAIVIERERSVRAPDGARTSTAEHVRLVFLDAAALEREGAAAGLRPAGRRRIPATAEHIGSTVVMLTHV